MNLPKDVQERLQKLKALADGGIGGEKRAAQAQYDRILSEFGLTDQDVNPQETRYETYAIRNQHEETLLIQLWAMVTHTAGAVHYRKESSRSLWFLATDTQHARLKAEFVRHRKPLAEHLERAAAAYCLAHDLVGPPSGRPNTMSAAELTRMRHAMNAVSLIDVPRAALGSGRAALGAGSS
ncbi:hypothetical protein IHN63_03255 [Deinococcus sp. 6YEL10]|uniref:hypothetical protein n=1 Tax=Deinococcus sp. 6YEL10 TaxID=2745870 RepID=UPI001E3EDD41|nr:hypothetical protein [Deinococcus sp. 6YEL10]MCD0160318.1 hypothetical protein [Deinococcus sp. 6YEL10]